MVTLSTVIVAGGGILLSIAVFVLVRWDARRVGVTHPGLWAAITAGTCVVGLLLYVFVPTAPLTGVILTANTGPVLYGFERGVAREGDDPADPGWIPGDPAGSESPSDTDDSESIRQS